MSHTHTSQIQKSEEYKESIVTKEVKIVFVKGVN